MPLTALDLPSYALKRYRPLEAVRRRKLEMRADLAKRRRKAYRTARKAAEILRREFGAQKVVVFGSLARRGGFTLWSDIDMAAWGIPSSRFFEAVAAVTGFSAEYKLDVIDPESCLPALRAVIEKEGKAL